MSIQWLQIDNQLYGSTDPIFLYPTVVPKEGENADEAHPVILASYCRSKDTCIDFFI